MSAFHDCNNSDPLLILSQAQRVGRKVRVWEDHHGRPVGIWQTRGGLTAAVAYEGMSGRPAIYRAHTRYDTEWADTPRRFPVVASYYPLVAREPEAAPHESPCRVPVAPVLADE